MAALIMSGKSANRRCQAFKAGAPETHRVDTGVEQGGEVSLYYDPMISKIIVHAGNRTQALAELDALCRDVHVYPIKTNARFLASCLSHPQFIAGDVSTNFIEQNNDALFGANDATDDADAIAKALLPSAASTPYENIEGWRLNQPRRAYFTKSYDGEDLNLPVSPNAKKANKSIARYKRPEGDVIFVDGKSYLIQDITAADDLMGGGNVVNAPMPGRIISVNVKIGDTVKQGDPLIVMEAMKMEMTLEAPRGGVIETVSTSQDALVADGDTLLSLEEE